MCPLAKNAVLQGPAPPRTGRRGAPLKKGDRLGTCADIAATAVFLAHRLTVYGQTATVSIAQVTGQWYTVFGATPARIILVRDDARDGKPCHLGLVTTDTTTSTAVAGLVVRYASRWSIGVMFSQIRNLLGAGRARNRVQAAVERTFPFQLIVYSIVIVWYVACSDTDVRQRAPALPVVPDQDRAVL